MPQRSPTLKQQAPIHTREQAEVSRRMSTMGTFYTALLFASCPLVLTAAVQETNKKKEEEEISEINSS